MSNEPIIVDNFLHLLNQRKIANIFQSAEINWMLKMLPSYGDKLAHLVFDQEDKQAWEDSPTLFHSLYFKNQTTDVSPIGDYVIQSFRQAIEKQINAKIEIIRCMAIAVIPNPNFPAQSMMPHTDCNIMLQIPVKLI